MGTEDAPSVTERLMDAVGGAQSLALSLTKQATSFAAEKIPPVPGFPRDVLDAPKEIVDAVFEQIEEALAERSPAVRDVIHQQATFVRGVFSSIEPIVAALADDTDEPPTRTTTLADTPAGGTSDSSDASRA
jgi:hypothetical protein